MPESLGLPPTAHPLEGQDGDTGVMEAGGGAAASLGSAVQRLVDSDGVCSSPEGVLTAILGPASKWTFQASYPEREGLIIGAKEVKCAGSHPAPQEGEQGRHSPPQGAGSAPSVEFRCPLLLGSIRQSCCPGYTAAALAGPVASPRPPLWGWGLCPRCPQAAPGTGQPQGDRCVSPCVRICVHFLAQLAVWGPSVPCSPLPTSAKVCAGGAQPGSSAFCSSVPSRLSPETGPA